MPAYQELYSSGELAARAADALKRLTHCTLCPHACGVDRTRGELGVCRSGRYAQVASYAPHFGEEAPLVGRTGSGTIFFAQCNLGCRFCQNVDISHPDETFPDTSPEELAAIMLRLQAENTVNINFVSPTHVVAQILEALPLAVEKGLAIPLVWNSGGYDSVETLRLLDGVVDVYMPDAKFWDPDIARRLCGAADYPQRAREAVREMHRQVGELHIDGAGVARKGLLIRHLVLPGGLSGTEQWMRFLADEISPDTYVNVMEQYRPCAEAHTLSDDLAPMARAVSAEECAEAVQAARNAGLTRLDERCGDAADKLFERLFRFVDRQ